MFNNKRLSLARKRRRLTKKRLAEEAGLSAMTISRLEKGENPPDDDTVKKIAKSLCFPVDFFFDDDPEDINVDAVSFRSLSKKSAKERDAAITAGSLGLQLNSWVEERFSLPPANILDQSYETNPEAAARSLRQFWGIGEKPVGNMLGLLETQGVRMFSLSESTASVDAFSFWRDDNPFVFLNNFKTAERSIFDSAHELGHLVMHKHSDPKPSLLAEREADKFASAFLMPINDVKSRMPRVITVATVLKSKFRWRVSAMAMTYRLHAIGLLSKWQYKSIIIELGKRGYRSAEPGGIERERSIIWRKILSQLWSERTTKSDIADSLNLPLDELEGLIWELVGDNDFPAKGKGPHLRSVK